MPDRGPRNRTTSPLVSGKALAAGRAGDPETVDYRRREGAKAGGTGSNTIAWSPINKQLKAAYSVALDETLGTIAASRSNTIQLYDLHSQTSLGTLVDPFLENAHKDVVQSLAFHPSGNRRYRY